MCVRFGMTIKRCALLLGNYHGMPQLGRDMGQQGRRRHSNKSRERIPARRSAGAGLPIIGLAVSLSGCMAAPYAGYYAAALAPSALMAGSTIYHSIEQADISASVQEDDKAEVRKLRRVAVIAVTENSAYAHVPLWDTGLSAGSGISEGLINGVSTSLKGGDIDVVDTFTIERALSRKGTISQDVNGREVYKRNDMVDAAFDVGAEGVLLLSAMSGMEVDTGGFYWWGASARTDVTVKTVSGRLLNRNGDMLLTVNVTYKNGQAPQEAGEAFGLVAAAKIKDPSADPKEAAKARAGV